MTGPRDPPDVPDLSAELSREEAIALRESFDHEEQERISHTVAELLDLLGKTHTMAVLSAFDEEPLRFSDLETELDIASNTPSTRLQDLTEAGLLDREAYDEVPPRVEYTPTERAESLFPVFAQLHTSCLRAHRSMLRTPFTTISGSQQSFCASWEVI